MTYVITVEADRIETRECDTMVDARAYASYRIAQGVKDSFVAEDWTSALVILDREIDKPRELF